MSRSTRIADVLLQYTRYVQARVSKPSFRAVSLSPCCTGFLPSAKIPMFPDLEGQASVTLTPSSRFIVGGKPRASSNDHNPFSRPDPKSVHA